jgi:hypothetical protein
MRAALEPNAEQEPRGRAEQYSEAREVDPNRVLKKAK